VAAGRGFREGERGVTQAERAAASTRRSASAGRRAGARIRTATKAVRAEVRQGGSGRWLADLVGCRLAVEVSHHASFANRSAVGKQPLETRVPSPTNIASVAYVGLGCVGCHERDQVEALITRDCA